MSYAFELTKDENGLSVIRHSDLAQIPEGTFYVSGHDGADGTLSTFNASLSVGHNLTASVSTTYRTK